MKLIESIDDHEKEWKYQLGELIFVFGQIEAMLFLICSNFLTLEENQKMVLSKKIEKSIGYVKHYLKYREHKIIENFVEINKYIKFRNSVVHGMLLSASSILGHHESCITPLNHIHGEIYLDDIKKKVKNLKKLAKELKENAYSLKL